MQPPAPRPRDATDSSDDDIAESHLERRLRLQRDMEERAAQYRLYLRTSAGGLEFGLSVVVGVLAGYFADRWLGSAPWGLLIGLGFGMAAGIRTLVRMVRKVMAESAAEEEEDGQRGGDSGEATRGADANTGEDAHAAR